MSFLQRCRVATLVVLAGSAVACAAELVLVQEGKPAAIVVIPDRGETGAAAATAASKVLCDHLLQMSGAKLDIRPARELGNVTSQDGRINAEPGKLSAEIQNFIFVGESALARQAGFTSEGLSAGGILVETRGNALGLIGSSAPGDPQSTTYAVIDCLETLGCRYLWPGESGKVIPKRSTVSVPALNRRFSPPIQQRGIRIMGMSQRPESGLKRLGLDRPVYDAAFAKATQSVSQISWSQWQRQGGYTGIIGGAAGAGLRGGWKEFGQTHPEWFAMQMDGTRDQSKAGDRWRLCVSNSGLIEHVTNDIIQRVNENPKLTCISICPNDGGMSSFCLCDECRKLDPPDAPKIKMLIFGKGGAERKEIEAPALTDRYVHYWNAIAQRVTKVHPNLLLLCEAYSYYSTPPVREKLHPNLVIRYVPSTTDGWAGWQRAGTRRIYWRPNILLSGRKDGMLHVQVSQLAQRMAYMAENGMIVTDFDSIIHSWATQGLNYYAAARLNWDPHLTAEQIMDDYCQGFGAAAAEMRKYFQRVQEITLKEDRAFTAGKIAELRGLLDAADKAAAGDSALLERIAFIRLGLNYTDLHVTLSHLCEEAAGKSGPELDAIMAKARPLLDLNYLVLRDIVKNHNLAVSAPYLMWISNEFAAWAPIGGRAYRPADAVLALGDDHTLSGQENSIDAMKAAFGLKNQSASGARPGGPAAGEGKTTIDADENGKPVEVLK